MRININTNMILLNLISPLALNNLVCFAKSNEAPFYKEILSTIKSLLKKNDIDRQKEAVAKIIKSGYENNVDELTVVVDEDFGFKTVVPTAEYDIKVTLGDSSHMEIHIKYKKHSQK